MKKLFCLFFTVLLISVSAFALGTTENRNTANEDLPPCFAWISSQVYNMMTDSFDTVWNYTYLGEVNYGTAWENQIACNFRATLAQAMEN